MRPLDPDARMPAVIIGCSCRSGWRRMRDSNSRGVAPNTLSNNAPQRSYQAGAVRDLGRPWPLGLGGRPRIPANETTNETAAESGRLTLASSSAGILLGLTCGKVTCKAGRAASRRQSASGLCPGTGITLGDRDVREERAPSRLHAPSRRSAWQRRLPSGQICFSGIGLATTQRRPTSLGCRDGGGISRLAWVRGGPLRTDDVTAGGANGN